MTYPLTRFGTIVVVIVTLTLSGTLVYAQSSNETPNQNQTESVPETVSTPKGFDLSKMDTRLLSKVSSVTASTSLDGLEAVKRALQEKDNTEINQKLDRIIVLLGVIARKK